MFRKGPSGEAARKIFRRLIRDPTALALVLFNLASGVIVAFHPPYVYSLFFLYWCDCLLIGFFGAVKLVFVPIRLGPAAGEHPVTAAILRMVAKSFLAAFFLFAYGYVLLCATALLGGLAGEEARMRPEKAFNEPEFLRGLWIPIVALLAGHLFSFIANFLGKREYRERTVETQMARPFGRVLPLLAILMIGGIAASLFRFPLFLVIVFVLVKIGADLAAHFWDHRSLQR